MYSLKKTINHRISEARMVPELFSWESRSLNWIHLSTKTQLSSWLPSNHHLSSKDLVSPLKSKKLQNLVRKDPLKPKKFLKSRKSRSLNQSGLFRITVRTRKKIHFSQTWEAWCTTWKDKWRAICNEWTTHSATISASETLTIHHPIRSRTRRRLKKKTKRRIKRRRLRVKIRRI